MDHKFVEKVGAIQYYHGHGYLSAFTKLAKMKVL